MSPTTIKQIRDLHTRYLKDRKMFDDANGIISPIRACVFQNRLDFERFLIGYAYLDEKAQYNYWKYHSRPIGYMLACKELATGKIKTAWSICAVKDIADEAFDNEFGIQIALNRLFKDNHKFSVKEIDVVSWSCTRAMAGDELPAIFFGENNMIIDQAAAFLKRCRAYYKGDEIV